MAPKKTILLLTAAILLTGLATANSFKESPEERTWLNNGAETNFEVTYSDKCTQNQGQIEILNSNSNSEVVETLDDGEKVTDEEGNTVPRTYDYSYSFESQGAGSYTLTASCTPEKDTNDNPKEVKEPGIEVHVGQLDLVLENLPEDTIYVGDEFSGDISVETNNDNIDLASSDLNYNYSFNEQDPDSNLEVSDGGFSGVVASDSDYDSFKVSASNSNLNFGVEAFQELDVQPVWQFNNLDITSNGEDVTDRTVKYRHLSTLEMSFKVTEAGEPVTGLTTDSFLFDGEPGWFIKEDQGSGNYVIEIEGRPQYSEEDLNVDENYDLPIELDTSSKTEEIVDLTVEKDVEFSGNVLDVSNNRVNTEFEAIVEREDSSNRIVPFSTDDSGNFQQFFETDTVDMDMMFPEAKVSLAEMNVEKEDAGDISYQYYSNPQQNSNINPEIDVRPVNLAAFVSNYPFQADSLDTYVEMQYDTSNVDPLEVEVYECSQWTFDAEECSSEWEKIDNNDVNLASGSTWKADFPINPLTSDRFATDEGVLQNAYLVGVPRGVGSSLTLEEGSVDGLPGRIQAGEEFSFSGTVIDSSTGEPVENADVSIELVSDGNDPVSPEDPIETDENGEFEYTDSIDQAGEYSVSLDVSKNPYDSFSYEEDSTMEVYYQTGLTVSAGENIDLQLGESSVIDFTLENTGQSEIQDLSGELDVTGIDDQYYSWSGLGSDSLESGDELRASLELTIPSSEDVTPGQKTVTLTASGSSADESLENSATVYATVPVQEEQDEQDSESSDTQEQNESGSPSVPGPQEVSQMTGEFVQSQSDMNLALGLILIFGAILAITVRKRKESDGRDGRMNGRTAATAGSATGSAGGRGKVQRPKVSPEVEETQEETEEKDQSEHSGSEEAEETEESEDDSDEFVCDKCGEAFDTESGLKLHRQALH